MKPKLLDWANLVADHHARMESIHRWTRKTRQPAHLIQKKTEHFIKRQKKDTFNNKVL